MLSILIRTDIIDTIVDSNAIRTDNAIRISLTGKNITLNMILITDKKSPPVNYERQAFIQILKCGKNCFLLI